MANCPKCGLPILENARYCTSCGYEKLRPKEIFEIPVYREWDDFRTNDFWHGPFLAVGTDPDSLRMISKAQFLMATVFTASPLILAFILFMVNGLLFESLIISLPLIFLLIIMRLSYTDGKKNMAYARVLDERINRIPADSGITEDYPPKYGRRI